ncbi:MAG TPA: UvrD-helicase domain-containing protein [Blastocatellia bacterium]|nr:UvrD-helicase domain-containing protein [Blastocatellia bacterium]
MSLTDLNDRQRDAVQYMGGPLLILAGAGSGKTRVITYKIAYLIEQGGIPPNQILAVTFTNKAADEMKERVARLLGNERLASQPVISTFHSFCVRVLRRFIEQLGEGYTSQFSIYDEEDQLRVIAACLRDHQLDERIVPARVVQALITATKSRGLGAEEFAAEVSANPHSKKAVVVPVFRSYEERLRASNALDFDDLLLKTVALLRRVDSVRAYYNDRFRFILVDEYQDTNLPQFHLLRLLTEKHHNICVVGDPDQSIYRWRGAEVQNINDFERHYRDARIITLDQNYRSTQTIIQVANAVIRHNRQRKEKTLRTVKDVGEPVRYYCAETGEGEARFVADRIVDLLAADPSHRVAVLYRTNAQSRLLEDACRARGLSFTMVGGFSFYKRAEIRDILAYLKLALNPWDDESFRRIINSPPRGIGRKTLEAIESLAREYHLSLWDSVKLALVEARLPERSLAPLRDFVGMMEALAEHARTNGPADVVRAAISSTGYAQALEAKRTTSARSLEAESRLLNLEELVTAATEAQERGQSLREFIDHAALISDADEYDPNAPVTLMTMHSAKGMEFPTVFIVGLEEDLFPHFRSQNDEAALEEERRLFYVAITRAQQRLFLTHARMRRYQGKEVSARPSRFLRELPWELVEDLSEDHTKEASGQEDHSFARPRATYSGKTYNTIESIRHFFAERGMSVNLPDPSSPPRSRSFRPGMWVRHPEYGIGRVLRREGQGDRVKLIVSFPGFGQRTLMEKVAPLEEV